MSRPKPNVKRLRRLIAILQPQTTLLNMKQFDTCALGVCCRDPWMDAQGFVSNGMWPVYKDIRFPFASARAFFGLSTTECDRLFGTSDWAVPHVVPSEVVIHRIEHIIDRHSGIVGAARRWLDLI